MRRSTWLLALPLLCAFPSALTAQTIQNTTLRRAQQAFDNLDYRQALSLGQASLRERLTGFERLPLKRFRTPRCAARSRRSTTSITGRRSRSVRHRCASGSPALSGPARTNCWGSPTAAWIRS